MAGQGAGLIDPAVIECLAGVASREGGGARRDIADAAVELRSWMAVARRRDDRAAIAEGEKLEGIIAGLAIVEAQIDALIDT